MIRRGGIYRVARIFRDPKVVRLVLVMTSDARNLDARSPTVVGVPLTTSLKGGAFRVRLKKGVGGVPETSEAACEQIVQVPKDRFVADERGVIRPLGRPVDTAVLDAVVASIVNVVSDGASTPRLSTTVVDAYAAPLIAAGYALLPPKGIWALLLGQARPRRSSNSLRSAGYRRYWARIAVTHAFVSDVGSIAAQAATSSAACP